MDLLHAVCEAGVVGCGGAGFPTHVKYRAQVECFIVNGAECEPLLRTDRYLMRHQADLLVNTAHLIGEAMGARQICIALKESYTQERAALHAAISSAGVPVGLHLLQNYYPAGDEQMIVCEVTGCSVPPAGIPLDVGAVVSNVATVLNVADALQGRPVTHKYLTVSGEVARPCILRVPIGTSFAACIAQAGGTQLEDYRVVAGGPMMGKVIDKTAAQNEVVVKTTSGILVVAGDSPLALRRTIDLRHTLRRARASCIQCSFCTQMCPRYLLGHPLEPHRIMRKLAFSGGIEEILEDADVQQALICCECGVCEDFACPMSLQPRQINALIKQEYVRRGVRYGRKGGDWQPREARELRKIYAKRLAARVGVLPWYDREVDCLVEYTPQQVRIPLRQHIGAPALPLVREGADVHEGQMIAACPKDALGANVHASITGIVQIVDAHAITLERRPQA